jgi:hypothetical protein
LVKGGDLTGANDNQAQRAIRAAIKFQYGAEGVEIYEQLHRDSKILLVDDWDDSPILAAEARQRLFDHFQRRFRSIIVAVDTLFDVKEMVGGGSNTTAAFAHYRMQNFNFSRRQQLIERWYSLSSDDSSSAAAFIERCDKAEKIVDSVMTSNIVPAAPLYILTLMQGIDAGRAGDFKDSALGYYYQYLLVEAFKRNRVPNEKLTELFQYCTHLSWFFHRNGLDTADEHTLRRFNQEFGERWVTVSYEGRIKLLVAARVLNLVGEEYSFRYPYIYYFFKGLYLSQTLSDIETRAYVAKCCSELYVRDSAHTVLFLAHHTNDPFVLQAIAETLHSIFRERQPVTLDGDDVVCLLPIITKMPALAYSPKPPEKARKERNELRDRFAGDQEAGTRGEEARDAQSLSAQMMTLTRTVEILGQVLKTQYAKIDRKRKSELLLEMFNGSLRSLRDFYVFLETGSVTLLELATVAVKKKDDGLKDSEATEKAQKFVAAVTLAVSHMLITRAASGANAEALAEDVHNVVAQNRTLAFRLIDMAIRLDSARPLPTAALKALIKDTSANVMAAKILQALVINRLYMFRTSETDMQFIAKEIGLDIKGIHAVAYTINKERRLK